MVLRGRDRPRRAARRARARSGARARRRPRAARLAGAPRRRRRPAAARAPRRRARRPASVRAHGCARGSRAGRGTPWRSGGRSTRTPPASSAAPDSQVVSRSSTTGKQLLLGRIPGLEQVVVQCDLVDRGDRRLGVGVGGQQHALGVGARSCAPRRGTAVPGMPGIRWSAISIATWSPRVRSSREHLQRLRARTSRAGCGTARRSRGAGRAPRPRAPPARRRRRGSPGASAALLAALCRRMMRDRLRRASPTDSSDSRRADEARLQAPAGADDV